MIGSRQVVLRLALTSQLVLQLITGSVLLLWTIPLRACFGQKAWSPVRESLGLLSISPPPLHLRTEEKLQLQEWGGGVLPKMAAERGP